MNTASLKLSKELYEISEWADTHFVWYFLEDYDCVEDSKNIVTCESKVDNKKTLCPAYTLDYLIRKLPPQLNRTDIKRRQGLTLTYHSNKQWEAKYQSICAMEADTPEDACAMLAIELIKEKVIQV